MIGFVDTLSEPYRLSGWAFNPDKPDQKLKISVLLDDEEIGSGFAENVRGDLSAYGDGRVAFDFDVRRRIYGEDFSAGRVRITASHGLDILGDVALSSWFAARAVEGHVEAAVQHLRSALRAGPPDLALTYPATGVGLGCMPGIMNTVLLQALAAPSAASKRTLNRPLDFDVRSILLSFESFGDNCEFGLVQRHYGAERPGLLRWGAAEGGVSGITKNIYNRFKGAGETVTLHDVNGEYMSFDQQCRLWFHTDRFVGTADAASLLRNERLRISYLARSLMEDLDEGEKIFAFKSEHGSTLDQALALSEAMSSCGTATLLWVTLAEREIDVGVVERIRPNLLHGYLDRFSPGEDIHLYCSYGGWARLCREALRLTDRRRSKPVAHETSPDC